ncbi:MAG: IS66 family transposase [Fibrobacter sp.]|nr:IS66 family transposase [Fibrobacter sp.]
MKLTDYKSKNDLPSDPEELRELLWSSILDNLFLTEQNTLLRNGVYAKSSEKKIVADDNQLVIEGLLELIPNVAPVQKDTYVETTVKKRRVKHPGRNAIPESIETETHIIDLSEQEKKCHNGCGDMVQIREEKRTVIERIPAKYVKHVYVQKVYGCNKCKDAIVAKEMPLISPLPRILPGTDLLLFVILSKYQFHLPLYRIQRMIFHESRIWFTRSTLCGWVAEICVPLKRIYDELVKNVKSGDCIHSDDTGIRCNGKSNFMWTYVNGAQTVTVFDYRESRGAAAPREFLTGVPVGSYLMTDCYASYNDAVKKHELLQLTCMMHVRREFVEAFETGYCKAFNTKALQYIRQLYRIESFVNSRDGLNEKERVTLRYHVRQRCSKPILDKLKHHLQNPDTTMVPKCRTAKAINYALNHWNNIVRYLERGDLPIDNGVSERVIRDLAIGRKNWVQVMSDNGGRQTAILFSIIATCKLNTINPSDYLKDVLLKIAIRPEGASVSDLTPVEWLKANNNGTLPEKQPLYPSPN